MSRLKAKIESLLFVSHKPLSIQKIAKILATDSEAIKNSINELAQEYEDGSRGFRLIKIGQSYQLVSDPANGKIIKELLKDEQTGEMTKPALETLTIVAYRGPISKSELDMIRGVNCSLILRNLMIKGLVEAIEDKNKMQTDYRITFDFIRHLGITELVQLPDYEKLNQNQNLEKLLHPELAEQEKNEQLQQELNKDDQEIIKDNNPEENNDSENPS
ncbi:SMC-Scp complex subunit ScpB [Patescibacteria group bacterium]|nr:SMC-Scp complex subunit ScpB [Patescibacteria group bacterium]